MTQITADHPACAYYPAPDEPDGPIIAQQETDMEAQSNMQEHEVTLLADEELDVVVGGREASEPNISEIVVTKRLDCASPKL